ncbi:MAG: nitrous oxide reductase accessory protein NosL, partial [Porticoccaceae bacterium]|nr:nitrous oxide reductase accessory protein NosL [Porticoccaceae bacterium]
MKRLLITFLLPLTLLAGCTPETETEAVVRKAVAIESRDECHLCGMIITNFPGPKGQLYAKGSEQNHKFCSTRDMFAFITDPENQHNIQQAFVHDMALTPWDKPHDEAFVDAKKAFYVIGHKRRGAMGPTLASFAEQQHAEGFA